MSDKTKAFNYFNSFSLSQRWNTFLKLFSITLRSFLVIIIELKTKNFNYQYLDENF